MLVLSGTFKAVEGTQATLIGMAKDLLPLSRSEAGCIRYDFFQDPIDPQRFLFFELWRTREDLIAHFEKPYFKIFAERLPAPKKGDRFIYPPVRSKVSRVNQGGFVCQGWGELFCRDTRITLSNAATTAKTLSWAPIQAGLKFPE